MSLRAEVFVTSEVTSSNFFHYRAVEASGPGREEAVRQGVLAGFPVHACLYPKARRAASHKWCGSRQGERRANKTGTWSLFVSEQRYLTHASLPFLMQNFIGKGKYLAHVASQSSLNKRSCWLMKEHRWFKNWSTDILNGFCPGLSFMGLIKLKMLYYSHQDQRMLAKQEAVYLIRSVLQLESIESFQANSSFGLKQLCQYLWADLIKDH